MSALGRALVLAAMGWPVFRAKSDKTPDVAHWKTDASTDPAAIRRMGWRADSLIGVALPVGTWALDVDDAAEWAKVGIDIGKPTQDTPHGHHWLFSGEVAQTVKKLPGTDTRTGGKGYVVCYSPSRWPSVANLQPAPPELIAALTGTTRHEQPDPDEGLGHRPEVWAFACRLRYAGARANEIYSALLQARDDGHLVALDESRPWRDGHLAQIARDASRKNSGDWTDYKPLTVRSVKRGDR